MIALILRFFFMVVGINGRFWTTVHPGTAGDGGDWGGVSDDDNGDAGLPDFAKYVCLFRQSNTSQSLTQ